MKRRFLLLASLLACALTLGISGCASPYRILVAPQQKVQASSLSLQVTAPRQSVDLLKQRRRTAPQLRYLMSEALGDKGFTLGGEQADRHLHVELLAVTLGLQGPSRGTENQGRCEVRASLYDSYPGALTEKSTVQIPPDLRFEVSTQVKRKGNYDRTDVGRAALTECANLVAAYLDDVVLH